MNLKDLVKLLLTLTSKLVAKSPLRKSVVNKIICFVPAEVHKKPEQCIEKFKGVQYLLLTDGYIQVQDGEQSQREFEHFVESGKFDDIYFLSMNNEKCVVPLGPLEHTHARARPHTDRNNENTMVKSRNNESTMVKNRCNVDSPSYFRLSSSWFRYRRFTI